MRQDSDKNPGKLSDKNQLEKSLRNIKRRRENYNSFTSRNPRLAKCFSGSRLKREAERQELVEQYQLPPRETRLELFPSSHALPSWSPIIVFVPAVLNPFPDITAISWPQRLGFFCQQDGFYGLHSWRTMLIAKFDSSSPKSTCSAYLLCMHTPTRLRRQAVFCGVFHCASFPTTSEHLPRKPAQQGGNLH